MNLKSLRRYSQFWYSGYAFQAIVVFGTGGILMPIVVNHAGNAAKAGAVSCRVRALAILLDIGTMSVISKAGTNQY